MLTSHMQWVRWLVTRRVPLLKPVSRVLNYLSVTKTKCIWYCGVAPNLVSFTVLDRASDQDTRRLTSG